MSAHDGYLDDLQPPCERQFQTSTSRAVLLSHRLPARNSREQGRVRQRPVRRPAKRSALLAQSHGCLDRLPQRRKIMIASHRLASTWSRRASTQCGERNWIAEHDLFKVRRKSGTYHEVIRPSGHRAVSPEHGTDRWAGPVRRGPGRHLRPVPAVLKSKAYLNL